MSNKTESPPTPHTWVKGPNASKLYIYTGAIMKQESGH